MANYIYNFLQVEGDLAQLMKFQKNALYKGQKNIHPQEVLVLDSLLPTSDNSIDPLSVYGTIDLYESFSKLSNNHLTYNFISNWCPPIIGFKNISQLYPDLTFILNFESSDANCLGTRVFKDGNILHSEEHSYHQFKNIELEYKKASVHNDDIHIDTKIQYYDNFNIQTYHEYNFKKALTISSFKIAIKLKNLMNKKISSNSFLFINKPSINEKLLSNCIVKDFHNNSITKLILPLLAKQVLINHHM